MHSFLSSCCMSFSLFFFFLLSLFLFCIVEIIRSILPLLQFRIGPTILPSPGREASESGTLHDDVIRYSSTPCAHPRAHPASPSTHRFDFPNRRFRFLEEAGRGGIGKLHFSNSFHSWKRNGILFVTMTLHVINNYWLGVGNSNNGSEEWEFLLSLAHCLRELNFSCLQRLLK